MLAQYTKNLLLFSGITLVALGYYLLAVPPDLLYEEMIIKVRQGVFSVVGGGGLLMVWLAKR